MVTQSIRSLQPAEQPANAHDGQQQQQQPPQPAPLILDAGAAAPPPLHTPHPRESYEGQGLSALAEEARGA